MSKWEQAVWLRVEARIAEDADEQPTQSRTDDLNTPGTPALGTVGQRTEAVRCPKSFSDHRSARPTEAPVRVLVADDHPLVRRQLRNLIESQLPGTVVEEADDGRQAVDKVIQMPPDIAVLDIAMPVLNGLAAT